MVIVVVLPLLVCVISEIHTPSFPFSPLNEVISKRVVH
nr:MAG TPA: hypothetical protein [Caudoviricetes sp.]